MIEPLELSETRHELVTLPDGSRIEIDQEMRRRCQDVYARTCARAVSRRLLEPGEIWEHPAPLANRLVSLIRQVIRWRPWRTRDA